MTYILIVIIRKIDRCKIQIEVYSTSIDKFRKKYLKTFLKINILYIVVFIISRLIPVNNSHSIYY